MRAMILDRPGTPLRMGDLPRPAARPHDVVLRVGACGVCRTDLHLVDGELPHPKLPVIPGHEIVGRVVEMGSAVTGWRVGDRVGVPWLGATCGHCRFCRTDRENLCDDAQFTGYLVDGGYAEYARAAAPWCVRLPDTGDDVATAPLLCAGLIGFRALTMAGDGATLGLYGFGAAAHIVAQVATAEGRRVYAFTRPGDTAGQAFARRLGAVWAGGSDERPPEPLDAAIIFAPVGSLVPAALGAVDKGGRVICAGIHMSDIPAFPYELLWRERSIRSVANLTRADARAFFDRLAHVAVTAETRAYPLERANEALDDLRAGRVEGAAVLVPGS
ncbi:MAG: zinc-dependent alcohol dehydrogenase family protein [Alphaproteobacteria bacterium]